MHCALPVGHRFGQCGPMFSSSFNSFYLFRSCTSLHRMSLLQVASPVCDGRCNHAVLCALNAVITCIAQLFCHRALESGFRCCLDAKLTLCCVLSSSYLLHWVCKQQHGSTVYTQYVSVQNSRVETTHLPVLQARLSVSQARTLQWTVDPSATATRVRELEN